MSEIHQGAVAVLDALGFKHISKALQPAEMFARMENVRERAIGFAESVNQQIDVCHSCIEDMLTVHTFSDSIILACREDPEYGGHPSSALDILVGAVLTILRATHDSQVAIAYRGAIAYGSLARSRFSIVGEAINEAAALEGLADGAFVWFAPSAVDRALAATTPLNLSTSLTVPYRVPMKDGRSFETRVVNPLARLPMERFDPDTIDEVAARCLGSFRDNGRTISVDVEMKRQNTYHFLRFAKEHAQQVYAASRERLATSGLPSNPPEQEN